MHPLPRLQRECWGGLDLNSVSDTAVMSMTVSIMTCWDELLLSLCDNLLYE